MSRTLIRGLFGHFVTRFLINAETARHRRPLFGPNLVHIPHLAEGLQAKHQSCGEDQPISARFVAVGGEPNSTFWSMTHSEPFSNPELEFMPNSWPCTSWMGFCLR